MANARQELIMLTDPEQNCLADSNSMVKLCNADFRDVFRHNKFLQNCRRVKKRCEQKLKKQLVWH